MTRCPYPNEYDPTAQESFDDTYAVFKGLRQNCPVAHSDAFDGFWAFSRYDDVLAALDDPGNFITSVRNVIPSSSTTGRRPPLHLDPPDHTPYRRAIDRTLSHRRIAAIEPAVRRHTESLLAGLIARGEGDFVEHVGSPLPALVFGEWMGLDAGANPGSVADRARLGQSLVKLRQEQRRQGRRRIGTLVGGSDCRAPRGAARP